jgi:hypothetical protein
VTGKDRWNAGRSVAEWRAGVKGEGRRKEGCRVAESKAEGRQSEGRE